MQVNKLKHCDIQAVEGNECKLDSPPNLLKLHQLMVFVGKRRSGKSQSCTNLIQMSKFDRTFVISGTFQSNRKIMNTLNIDPKDVYDPDHALYAIKEIMHKIEAERDDYEMYHAKLKKWNLLNQYMNTTKTPVDLFPTFLMMEFDELQIKPWHRWGGRVPKIALMCDDCQSTRLFNVRQFLNLCMRHRHIGPLDQGGAIGLSVFLCIQNYKSQYGGCPRAVKNNATALAIYKIQSEKELDDIYEGVAGEITRDQFDTAYAYATAKPHGFLLIDLHPRDGHTTFRSQFNEMITFKATQGRFNDAGNDTARVHA